MLLPLLLLKNQAVCFLGIICYREKKQAEISYEKIVMLGALRCAAQAVCWMLGLLCMY